MNKTEEYIYLTGGNIWNVVNEEIKGCVYRDSSAMSVTFFNAKCNLRVIFHTVNRLNKHRQKILKQQLDSSIKYTTFIYAYY